MISEVDIGESRRVINGLIQEGIIVSSDKKFVDFFLAKAESSLATAQALLKISINNRFKIDLNLSISFDAYMWVVNASYYSMFYSATALLAKYNHRIKTIQSIHQLTYHALVYYFLDCDKKLTHHILEQYRFTEQHAAELLQIAEQKAREQIEKIKLELTKRGEFTYDMGKIAERSKAETSIKRAQEFLTLVKELML